ncbi:MAG TPA: type II secretion system protein [Patescibacteria group bacterium]|nr:type II secretion system protein [Patescibacteria group bacterium]
MKKINTIAQQGFTLIELLVVIGVLAVLLAITLIAINPARQFAQANNTKRSSDVNAVLNAVHQYGADNKGDLSALGITSILATAPNPISNHVSTGGGDVAGVGNAFCTKLVTQYIAALPSDPLTTNGTPVLDTDCVGADTWNTGYQIYRTQSNNRITVVAPLTELGVPTIEVTR